MTYFSFTRRSSTLPLQTYVTRYFGNTLAHAGQASPRRRTPDGTSLPLPLLRYAHSPRGHSQLGLVPGATPGSVGPAEHTGGCPRKDVLANGPTVHITRCLHHSMGAPGKAGLYVLAASLPTLTLFRATSREGAFRRVRRPHLQPRGANPRPFNTFSAPRWVSPLL